MTLRFSSRIRAFLWHLSISGLIGLTALVLVFFVWYPAPLQKAVGVTEIFLIVLAVDVILGPCLTLAVARPGKKRHLLIMDLSIIIACQIAALVYGLSTVAQGRPSWIVLNTDRADLVRTFEVDTRHLDKAQPEYRKVPWGQPQWVFATLPEDAPLEEKNNVLIESATGGPDLYHRPEYYAPVSVPEATAMLRQKAQPLEKLAEFNPPEMVATVLAETPQADAWLPLMCNVQAMTVLVNKKEGRILKIVDLNPWL
ncbi:MAG: hypothetical protein LBR88_00095 [Zoogloeaceae bacterium]|jgi:hypothetical protein|nr:hypothetical protein [Zoogloeaceae bacterium]